MKDSKIKTTIVNLNNKSRKGDYLRVSSPKKKTRYYKIKDEPQQIDTILKHYNNKYITKKGEQSYNKLEKAWKETYKKPKQRRVELKKTIREVTTYIRKVRKRGTITQQLTTGINSITIDPTQETGNTTKNKIMNTLLNNIVLDPKIKKLLCTEENFNKLKNRLEYNLRAKSTTNETSIEANSHGKTLNEALQESKQATNEPNNVGGGSSGKVRYLKNKGWFAQDKIETNDQPDKWTLTITLRKGQSSNTIRAK